jgi:hypothetical protein
MYKDEEDWIRKACFVLFTQPKLVWYFKNPVMVQSNKIAFSFICLEDRLSHSSCFSGSFVSQFLFLIVVSPRDDPSTHASGVQKVLTTAPASSIIIPQPCCSVLVAGCLDTGNRIALVFLVVIGIRVHSFRNRSEKLQNSKRCIIS